MLAMLMLLGAGSARAEAPSTPLVTGAPVLTVPGPQSVSEGVALSFGVSATDPEGQSVDLRASNLPIGATFTNHFNNTGTFDWTPQSFQAGSYIVFFTADDTFGGVTSRSVDIEVLDANNAPALDPISDRTVNAGSTIILMATGTDPDGDALTYTTSGVPPFGSFTDYGDGTASLVLSPPSGQPSGTFSITLTLSDGLLGDSESFTVTVVGTTTQHAPNLASIGNQTAAEGATRSVGISAWDVDGGLLTWTVSLPGFATFTPTASGPGVAQATLALAPGYCDSGNYPASVAVSDGSLSTSESFAIQVSNVNRSPVWGGPYAVSLPEGGSADLPVGAPDPDQSCGAPAPILTIVGSNGGSALILGLTDAGNGTGTLHVAASPMGAGSYQVTLRASDPTDGTATPETQVSVTVSDVNRAPTADAGGPYAGIVGFAVSFNGAGSDPDGDAVQLTWSFGDGAQAAGAAAAHAYAATGVYTVVLTASDGTLSDPDTTSASISTSYQARAWTEPGSMIRLQTGKPRETVLLEPLDGAWDLSQLDLGTLALCASPGTGSVECITPLAGKTTANHDSDHNGIVELAMEFSKDDLRLLLANVTDRATVVLTLRANFIAGGTLSASLTIDVIPERRALRRVSPNPLNPEAVVTVGMDRPGALRLRVYDMSGRLVRTLVDVPSLPAGNHDVPFNGRDDHGRRLASGRYFLRAEAAGAIDSAPITVLK